MPIVLQGVHGALCHMLTRSRLANSTKIQSVYPFHSIASLAWHGQSVSVMRLYLKYGRLVNVETPVRGLHELRYLRLEACYLAVE